MLLQVAAFAFPFWVVIAAVAIFTVGMSVQVQGIGGLLLSALCCPLAVLTALVGTALVYWRSSPGPACQSLTVIAIALGYYLNARALQDGSSEFRVIQVLVMTAIGTAVAVGIALTRLPGEAQG